MLTEMKKRESDDALSLPISFLILLRASDLENVHELLNGRRAFLKRSAFVIRETDLDDLLDAVLAEFDRHADEEIVNAVFAFEEDCARQDLFLIFQNRLGHLNSAKARCVIS